MQTATQSTDRVRARTPESIVAQIDRETETRVAAYAGSSEGSLTRRIRYLGQEWDVERATKLSAASIILSGLAAGAPGSSRWRWLSIAGAAMLLHHATRGWSPFVPLLRRLGVRTRQEIDAERYALMVLRGDFDAAVRERDRSRRAGKAYVAARGVADE